MSDRLRYQLKILFIPAAQTLLAADGMERERYVWVYFARLSNLQHEVGIMDTKEVD
ncbi:MAG: hypothetical protein JST09_07125 [Bacteroidetes bacterium]|nr:hypothetical protein [Bacteroidota bacterium]MBS1608849.1 hypothetical protein [Bacteroidota bacterium]